MSKTGSRIITIRIWIKWSRIAIQ